MSDDDTTGKAAPKPRTRKTSAAASAKPATKAGSAKKPAATKAKSAAPKKPSAAKKPAQKTSGWKKAAIGVSAGVGSAAVAAAVLYATKLKKSEQPSPIDLTRREPEES